MLLDSDQKRKEHVPSVWFPQIFAPDRPPLPASAAACHLTRLVLEEARRMTERDLLNFTDMAHTPALHRWVATTIITAPSREERLTALAYFLQLGAECERLGNWVSARDILVGEARRLHAPSLSLDLTVGRSAAPARGGARASVQPGERDRGAACGHLP